MIKRIYYLYLQEENQISLKALQKIKHSENAFYMHICVSTKIMGVNYFWLVLQVNRPVSRYVGQTWMAYRPFKLENAKAECLIIIIFQRNKLLHGI